MNTKKLLKSSMKCNEAYSHNFLQGWRASAITKTTVAVSWHKKGNLFQVHCLSPRLHILAPSAQKPTIIFIHQYDGEKLKHVHFFLHQLPIRSTSWSENQRHVTARFRKNAVEELGFLLGRDQGEESNLLFQHMDCNVKSWPQSLSSGCSWSNL